ncbi:ribonuclease T2 family protein [Rhodobaculum claviforme]|uniref:Uncharacterized protein n=1 Tax=Rhodobaculum claviforme TaxID=1549854 RepID=A0A934WKM4_9RHOB|nr:ribonuclease T2 [Rhodobaculum claviforme]MBK5928708.1 hypothetical protein [Rhodobaculum claviforme]
MRWLCLAVVVGLVVAPGGRAAAAEFDHYLLALSWTPAWCHFEGAARGDARCDPGADTGWMVHGLWPQHARGWPEYCATTARDPSRGQTAAMVDIMGSAGLAWHQWRKHGRCSGLTAQAYFAQTRAALVRVTLPEVGAGAATAQDIADAVRAANPGIGADGLVVTCRQGRLAEVRICLTPTLDPRPCGADVRARACSGPLEVTPRP